MMKKMSDYDKNYFTKANGRMCHNTMRLLKEMDAEVVSPNHFRINLINGKTVEVEVNTKSNPDRYRTYTFIINRHFVRGDEAAAMCIRNCIIEAMTGVRYVFASNPAKFDRTKAMPPCWIIGENVQPTDGAQVVYVCSAD